MYPIAFLKKYLYMLSFVGKIEIIKINYHKNYAVIKLICLIIIIKDNWKYIFMIEDIILFGKNQWAIQI